MKFEAFVLLTEDEKMSVLWHHATIIAERKVETNVIFLYQVYSFYLEVWFAGNLLDIENLVPFEDTDELEPYLKNLNIESLMASL